MRVRISVNIRIRVRAMGEWGRVGLSGIEWGGGMVGVGWR